MKKSIVFLLALLMTAAQAVIKLVPALAFNAIVAVTFAMITQAPVVPILIVAQLIGVSLGYAKRKFFIFNTDNLALAGVLREIWIAQLMEKFYSNMAWMNRSQDMSEYVNNNVINLADAGSDPTVLVDNATYPVPTVERTDTALTLPLQVLDTYNDVIRNAQEKQLSYSKRESIIRGHRNTLAEKSAAIAGVNWAPAADGANTPVFATTGTTDAVRLRKALSLSDVAKMQKYFDTLKIPVNGRVMLLNPQHRMDLLNEDKALFKAFANLKAGEVLPLYGFDVYMTQLTATYNGSTGAKKALGAAAAGTDSEATMFWHEAEVMKAEGSVDMFFKYKDPEQRGDVLGFQKFFIARQIRSKYVGAAFSAITT